MYKKFLFFLAVIFITLFFSYKLLEVPLGLTVDEAAFGYNAALLSNSWHDENGRFLPVFVLSIEGKDWRQPVTQYYQALYFKIFSPSVFNLRFSSVIWIIASATLLFILGRSLFATIGGFFSVIIFLTTPLVLIQSHLALDNITPIPFTIVWLLAVHLFRETKKRRYLIISAVALGIGFYSYKAMRAIVPIWIIITSLYLLIATKKIKPLVIFLLSSLPFFAVIPLIEKKYPGAILSGQHLDSGSLYSFLYPYFASFDLSFLFITGDTTIFHSTGHHGMFLLATLPVFIVGCFELVKQKRCTFLLVALFLAPILFGLVDSVHRASRLMALIPIYSLISTAGLIWLLKKRAILSLVIILMVVNYLDFTRYYFFSYPKASENSFSKLITYKSYEKLAIEAKQRNLTPYVSEDLAKSEGESGKFFEIIYFGKLINKWMSNEINPPLGSILLTTRDEVRGLKKLDLDLKYYKLQVNE